MFKVPRQRIVMLLKEVQKVMPQIRVSDLVAQDQLPQDEDHKLLNLKLGIHNYSSLFVIVMIYY